MPAFRLDDFVGSGRRMMDGVERPHAGVGIEGPREWRIVRLLNVKGLGVMFVSSVSEYF